MLAAADHVGRKLTQNILYAWELFKVFYLSVRATIVGQKQSLRTIVSVISSQIYFTGYQALPLITGLSLATGAIVVMQSTSQFNILGGGGAIGQLIVVVVVREIAPLLTALIVIARSGTAVASELGNMKANREIESLTSMGIDPLSYIVFPRLCGGVISVVCLGFYFVLGSMLGGLLVAKGVYQLPLAFYLDSVTVAFTKADVFLFLAKVFFSGSMIFTIASYQGMQVKLGPHEVPQVTTAAVMNSIIMVIVFNLTVTSLFYLHHLMALGVL
jgi:phospholipid/cholesterol/gamma-HCH transport system permease protein